MEEEEAMTEPEFMSLKARRDRWRALGLERRHMIESGQCSEEDFNRSHEDVSRAYREYISALLNCDEYLLALAEQASKPL
jgi:hypothetical protein